MATVYLARDLRQERDVAIKVLRSDLTSELSTDRFGPEIKLAARINHPHILPLFDSGERDDIVYFVMPRVEDESLRERLGKTKQLPLDDVLSPDRPMVGRARILERDEQRGSGVRRRAQRPAFQGGGCTCGNSQPIVATVATRREHC